MFFSVPFSLLLGTLLRLVLLAGQRPPGGGYVAAFPGEVSGLNIRKKEKGKINLVNPLDNANKFSIIKLERGEAI